MRERERVWDRFTNYRLRSLFWFMMGAGFLMMLVTRSTLHFAYSPYSMLPGSTQRFEAGLRVAANGDRRFTVVQYDWCTTTSGFGERRRWYSSNVTVCNQPVRERWRYDGF